MAATCHSLTDETVLIVEEFVLVEGTEKPQSLSTTKLLSRHCECLVSRFYAAEVA
jgi:hypothetical protein